MRTLGSANRTRLLFWLPATLVIASCAGTSMNTTNILGPQSAPPAYQADAIAGRYGLAAYERDEDRTRTEAEARQQCRQPYEIQRGPSGGLIMHLADQAQPQELQLKGLAGGKTFIGPEGEAGGEQDREIVSFDGRILVLRWVSQEIAARYGTAIYVRCEGTPPRTAKKKSPPKKAGTTKSQTKGPVFMAPPPQEADDEPPSSN